MVPLDCRQLMELSTNTPSWPGLCGVYRSHTMIDAFVTCKTGMDVISRQPFGGCSTYDNFLAKGVAAG